MDNQLLVKSDTLNSVSRNSHSAEVTGHGVQGVFKPTIPKRKIGQPGYYHHPTSYRELMH